MNKVPDGLADLITSFRERFTNPLVFSFICSWLILNWRVPLALIWTDSTQKAVEAHGGLMVYISNQFSWCRSVWWPLVAAAAFVLILPLFKAGLRIFLVWVQREGTARELRISGEGNVSVRRYIQLRESQQAILQKLSDVLKVESDSIEERTKTDLELADLRNGQMAAQTTIRDLERAMNDAINVRLLDGWWKNEYNDPKAGKGVEYVYIESGRYSIADIPLRTDVGLEHKFNIVSFQYFVGSNDVSFVKELVESQKIVRPPAEHYSLNILKFDEEQKVLSGSENRQVTIKYTRIERPDRPK